MWHGPHTNEQLIGKAIAGKRDQACSWPVPTRHDPANPIAYGVNGRPDYIRNAIDGTLQRLRILLNQTTRNELTPTWPSKKPGAMADLGETGQYLGLERGVRRYSERAHKVHPISALQSEYSLWSRD